jgi:hypothetical protein
MFRKALIFLLFCLASPAWLLMRARYGRQFSRYLFLAWAVMTASTWAVLYLNDRNIYPGDPVPLHLAWAVGAGYIYTLGGLLWLMQLPFALLHRLAVHTGDGAPAAPWYTGAFPLYWGTPRIFDHIFGLMGAFTAWMFFYAPNGTVERGISLTLLPMLAAFWMLSFSLRWNDNRLPYSAAAPHTPKPDKIRVTQVAPKARTQDGLREVFSRRDPALIRITQAG